jgi:hypothetical protein
MDYFIPADVHYGLVRLKNGSDGNNYPYSIDTGEFIDVLKDQTVIYHRKVETNFEKVESHGSWAATTFFETGIFSPYCKTYERYWLEIEPRLLRLLFNAYSANIWVDKIVYDAYGEDFSMNPNPDLNFSKYYWRLELVFDNNCLPKLECKKEWIDQCLGLC